MKSKHHVKNTDKLLFKAGTRVMTKDGPGKTIGVEMRKGNSGQKCRQYRVMLDDGRVRHYSTSTVNGLVEIK